MILEYGIEQHECLHKAWGKTNDGYESYWKVKIAAQHAALMNLIC
jgi:hypothetical protein